MLQLLFIFFSFMPQYLSSNNEIFQQDNPLSDDCAHIFFDLGANLGVQARKLYEGNSFVVDGPIIQIFKQLFGETNRANVCTFAFEPNPRHEPRLREMEAVYRSLGIRYNFFSTAVGTKAASLHLSKPNSYGQAAATLMEGASRNSVLVKVINFLAFFRKQILQSNFFDSARNPRGKIFCKMDIEGEEFNLLPRLIQSGIVCHLDLIATEFHRSKSRTGGFLANANQSQLIEFQANISNIAQRYTPGCKTVFWRLDDESYANDNFTTNPLPIYRGAPLECSNPHSRCVLSEPIPGMTREQYSDAVYGLMAWK